MEPAFLEMPLFALHPPVRLLTVCCGLIVLALLANCDTRTPGDLRMAHMDMELQAATQRSVAPPDQLTADMAVDYALQYNLNLWVTQQQRLFQQEMAEGQLLNLLPRLSVDADGSARNRFNAATSVSIVTGRESLEPSYSSQKQTARVNVAMIWSLLDFGVSLVQAQQADRRVLIAERQLQRQCQRLAHDVRTAWWRTVAAREVARHAQRLDLKITAARLAIHRQLAQRNLSELEALQQELPLIEQQLAMNKYRRIYERAKVELAELMGAPVDQPLHLAEVDFQQLPAFRRFAIHAMEQQALLNRPELYEADQKQMILQEQANIALLRILPSPSLMGRWSADSNKLLYYHHWATAGLSVTWDLLAIPAQLNAHEAAKIQSEIESRKRLAMAVGILTQIRLAVIDYEQARNQLLSHHELFIKRRALDQALRQSNAGGQIAESAILEHELKYLTAQAGYVLAYANLMSADSQINQTLGYKAQTSTETQPTTPPSSQPTFSSTATAPTTCPKSH